MDPRRHAHENEPELSPLEQEVLDEYAKLVGNLDDVCQYLLALILSSSLEESSTDNSSAVRNPSRARSQPLDRDPRLVARPGTENCHGLHVAES